jgi:hypothetical protein
MTAKVVLRIVLAAAVSFGSVAGAGAADTSPGRDYFTRKRVNGKWITGVFPKEEGSSQPAEQASTEPSSSAAGPGAGPKPVARTAATKPKPAVAAPTPKPAPEQTVIAEKPAKPAAKAVKPAKTASAPPLPPVRPDRPTTTAAMPQAELPPEIPAASVTGTLSDAAGQIGDHMAKLQTALEARARAMGASLSRGPASSPPTGTP